MERSEGEITGLQEQMEKVGKNMRMSVKAEVRRAMLYKDPNE